MLRSVPSVVFLGLSAAMLVPAAAQQPASAPPAAAAAASAAALPYASVAAARKAVESHDGDGFIVTHSDGWTIANEPLAAAQWSFTPSGYFAYPAVVRRIIRRLPGGEVSVEIATLCEAPADACARLVSEFEELNERVRQSVKSRLRAAPPGGALPLPAPSAAPK